MWRGLMRACLFGWDGLWERVEDEGWERTDDSPGDGVDGWFNLELGRCDASVGDPRRFLSTVGHRSLACCVGKKGPGFR